jgi:putative phage-type endonuclease
MKIHNIEQRTEEWFAIKKGKLGASHAQAIATAGKGLETYIIELMAEYYSIAPKESYTNEHMERGNELEAQARAIYELETGNEVEEVGFIELDEYVGCSPDGMVGEDGLIEIKCPSDKVYLQYLLDDKIDSGYMWQMQMQMLICDRKWCDYVCYNPNFEKSIVIARVKLDGESIDKLSKGFDIAVQRIEEIKTKMREVGNGSK